MNEEEDSRKDSSVKVDVPILLYRDGESPNLQTWKEAMTTLCGILYGSMNRVLKEKEFPDLPYDTAKELTEYNEANDPHKILIKDIANHRRINTDQEIINNKNKIKMYFTMWSKISTESKARIKTHKDFEKMDKENNPLLLWQAILDILQP
jgi:hypothetical protein